VTASAGGGAVGDGGPARPPLATVLPPHAAGVEPVRPRLASIDALRGVVMLLLFAEALRTCVVAEALPLFALWRLVCEQQSHAEWAGWHLHDLIQPLFTFLVGVSMPLSIASRRARGDSNSALMLHAARRAVILVALGVAVQSVHPRAIVWTFLDTLTQIGLGYAFVFALALAGPRWWRSALAVILLVVWLAFAAYPVAGPAYDFSAVGVTAEWLQQHGFSGWRSHWQKNANVAFAFDARFLPLFPGNADYFAPKGLTTLNFVPTMATMILGLSAGHALAIPGSAAPRLRRLLMASAAGLISGLALDATGLCPIVKSLWTPSWVLFSGGLCFLFIAASHWIVDVHSFRRAAFVLIVVGSNSLAAYLLTHLYPAFAWGALRRLFGEAPFAVLGPVYEPFIYGLSVMLVYWLVLYALHRVGWHLRI
jgi:heparan-alpha-glucosaminide N-acetyltransferase